MRQRKSYTKWSLSLGSSNRFHERNRGRFHQLGKRKRRKTNSMKNTCTPYCEGKIDGTTIQPMIAAGNMRRFSCWPTRYDLKQLPKPMNRIRVLTPRTYHSQCQETRSKLNDKRIRGHKSTTLLPLRLVCIYLYIPLGIYFLKRRNSPFQSIRCNLFPCRLRCFILRFPGIKGGDLF